MGNPRVPLTFNVTYHIYNYSVGSEKLFRENWNYPYFLGKIQKWITPVAEIISWSLEPEYFQFCLRIRTKREIARFFGINLNRNKGDKQNTVVLNKYLERKIIHQFSNCFNSYAQGYNKTYKRRGALFRESFYRKPILSLDEFWKTIDQIYLHPVLTGLVPDPYQWKYSSFRDSLTNNLIPFTTLNQKLKPIKYFKMQFSEILNS